VIRRALFLAVIATLVGSLAGPAFGDSLEQDLKEIRESMLAIEAAIDDVAAERSMLARDVLFARGKLDAVESEMTAARARLTRIEIEQSDRNAALDAVRSELAERFAKLSVIRDQRDSALDDAKASVLHAYMSGGTSEPSIAFSATAVTDVSVGVAYLDVLTGHRAGAAGRYAELVAMQEAEEAKVKAVETAIAVEVAALVETAVSIDVAKADLEVKRTALSAEYDRQQVLLVDVEAAIYEFEGEITALAREEASIKSKIRAASEPTGTKPGQLVRPVPGAISSGFGPRVHPILGTMRMHNGVDMNASQGDAIKAAAAGRVILAGVKGGFGNTIMIDHGGGMVTLYAHQSRIGASVGQKVTAGETIGYIGSTGLSTGPHLHFEVRIYGVPKNPTNYI
jgi:murein DD-endopeptidase MepM/ murein hydrolase activator NlpD